MPPADPTNRSPTEAGPYGIIWDGSPTQLPLAGKVGRRYTSPRFRLGLERGGGTARLSTQTPLTLQGGMNVERLLIVGIDTVVGANLATHLADKFHVIGLSSSEEISIEGCETAMLPLAEAATTRQAVAVHRPDHIVLCQAAGDASWHRAAASDFRTAAQATLHWIEAAHAAGKRLTLISSDAVLDRKS